MRGICVLCNHFALSPDGSSSCRITKHNQKREKCNHSFCVTTMHYGMRSVFVLYNHKAWLKACRVYSFCVAILHYGLRVILLAEPQSILKNVRVHSFCITTTHYALWRAEYIRSQPRHALWQAECFSSDLIVVFVELQSIINSMRSFSILSVWPLCIIKWGVYSFCITTKHDLKRAGYIRSV